MKVSLPPTEQQKRRVLLNIEIDKGLADLRSGNTVSPTCLWEDLLARRKTYQSDRG